MVSPGYLQTLGIPLRSGRLFTEADDGRALVVISASAAERLWPGQSPIGKTLRVGGGAGPLEVVGIVGDVRGVSLDERPKLTVYLPYWQPSGPPNARAADLSLAMRTGADPASLPGAIRDVIRRLDPELPLQRFRTMAAVIDDSIGQRRFQTMLVLLFAAAATLLASLGIYGVVSYAVAQRRHEVGIRMALGARPNEIRRLVLRQGLVPVTLGLAVGLALAALLANGVLGAILFGVRPTDPVTLAGVGAVVLLVAVVATLVPARRATRVDPLQSLRPQ